MLTILSGSVMLLTTGIMLNVEGARPTGIVDELVAAAHALSRAGLVTAFGHLSCRTAPGRLLITPPVAPGRIASSMEWVELDVESGSLPAGVPREAWIHLAIARVRPDVGAICRAQPPVATALASAGVPIVPLHGQGTYVGALVPVFDDAVLIRDETRAVELARELGPSPALILRGNGAVTVGADVGEAVARMWVLEASSQINSVASAAGKPAALSRSEQEAWQGIATEILGRIWDYLRQPTEP
jgi:HCOMODA/2-hydroxy-3-carboxy-muconic semialdehyde decarboxylase